MSFRIYFFGLISHLTTTGPGDDKNHSVLIRDGGHRPTIEYFNTAGVFKSVDILKAAVREISFGAPAAAPIDNAFHDFVPHLQDITKGGGHDIKNDVKGRTNVADAYCYVQYPGGTWSKFHVHSLYPCMGSFSFGPPPQCVARVTVLEVNTVGPVPLSFNGTVVDMLSTDACVLIENVSIHTPNPRPCDDHSSGHSAAHLGRHIQITTAQQIADIMNNGDCGASVHPPEACEWILKALKEREKLETSIHIECSNTQWP